MNQGPEKTAKEEKTVYWAFFLILGAGFILRVLACLDAFWMDEIWSWHFSQGMNSVWDVFFFRHDNNHILNTLHLFFAGNAGHWFYFRLLSLAAGMGSLFFLYVLALKYGRPAALTVLFFAAVSYPLVLYSSEARGYAPAMFFGLCAFYFLDRFHEKGDLPAALLFLLSVALGFLSHLTFALVYFSFLAWSIFFYGTKKDKKIKHALRFSVVHGPALVFAAGLYFFWARSLVVAGANYYTPLKSVALSALVLAAGAPDQGFFVPLAVLSFVFFLSAGLVAIFNKNRAVFVFYLCSLLLFPVLFLVLRKNTYLHPRYVAVVFPFFLLLAGLAVSRLWGRAFWGKFFVVFLAGLFCLLNGVSLYGLLTDGRGDYRAVVEYLAQNTEGPEILVGSDDDFTNKMVLSFYRQYLPKEKKILYCGQDKEGLVPEWVLGEEPHLGSPPPKKVRTAQGKSYVLVRTFDQSGVSGWPIYVFKIEKEPGF